MKTVFLIGSVLSIVCWTNAIVGCGQNNSTAIDGTQPLVATASIPNKTPDAIMAVVNDYNAWRLSNGQETIEPGLTCNLYTVPNTTTAIIGATGLVNVGAFTYQGVFDQVNASVTAGLNVLPSALQAVYQTWFILKCTGYLVVTTDDFHGFDVTSDDGSNLYVDGALVVPNDGLHGIKDVSGSRHLQDIVHSFEIDFLQANGSQALVVNMDNTLLPSEALWH